MDLDEGEYFIADLLGCEVITEMGEVLGVIFDISQDSGSVDVISARTEDGKEFRFPFLNRIVDNVNVAEKHFTVIKRLLDEVCVYDD